MNPDRRKQIEALCHEGLGLAPAERTAFLDRACGNDAVLRTDVDALIRAQGEAERFLASVPGAPRTLSGRTIGNYHVMELVGRGGMGAVYRARDQKLKRDVAIKVLPDQFSSDMDRVRRFRREAETLASLNHPHIAAIHDIQESQGSPILVLEFVEGETLADRIERGPVPVDKALTIAMQIADALEAAHDKGVIHCDLKPANIKLSGSDIKVLDFGLAKVRERAGVDLSTSPTLVTESSPGSIAGTPAYMSPEQAKGTESGRASDIWAFGCVLFELVSGKRPFRGETAAEILADVLKAEPAWESLPATTPAPIQRILRRCLQKDVRSRFHDMADVRIALEDAAEFPSENSLPRTSKWRERVGWAAALLVITAGAFFYVDRIPGREIQVDIVTPPQAEPGGIALSPDGTEIVYAALNQGISRLYRRSLDTGSVSSLSGTDGASLPFWSPNGRSVAFFAEGKLKRIDIETGAIQPLASATLTPSGGSWSKDGTILYSPAIRNGIYQIRETGGDAALVIPEGRAPHFLDGGPRFLFHAGGYGGGGNVRVGSVDNPGASQPLINAVSALPGPPGYVLHISWEGTLSIQGFDSAHSVLTGTAVVLAQRVLVSSDGGSVSVTASSTGDIAFREVSSEDAQPRRISWFDREGKELERVGELGGLSPALSPDGAYVAVGRRKNGTDVWLLETARGVLEPFTTSGANQTPVFSPDGREIIFASARRLFVEPFIKPLSGGEEKPLFDSMPDTNGRVVTDWSNDFLVYRENAPETNFDIWALPLHGNDQKPLPILTSKFAERDAQVSPNGKWIAYESDKSGRSEIYVTQFPVHGREFPISINGGAQVRWNPNGNELFYVSLDGRLMSVPIQSDADGRTVKALDPTPLFQTRIGTVVQGAQKQQYVVSTNGQRFLVSHVIEETLSPITLILNWKPPVK